MSLRLAFEAFRVFIRTKRLPVRAGTSPVHMVRVFFVAMLLWCNGLLSQAHVAQSPQTVLQYHDDVIRNARFEWGLPVPTADFAAQLHQESGWRPGTVSSVGAQGLAQFMSATTGWISQLIPGPNSHEPLNPVWAVRAPVSYDRWLWQRISTASGCERTVMALSGYNGSLGWVQRDRQSTLQKGLDSIRWFGHATTVSAGRSTASWQGNRHYPQRVLLTLIPRYLSWGGASCVGT